MRRLHTTVVVQRPEANSWLSAIEPLCLSGIAPTGVPRLETGWVELPADVIPVVMDIDVDADPQGGGAEPSSFAGVAHFGVPYALSRCLDDWSTERTDTTEKARAPFEARALERLATSELTGYYDRRVPAKRGNVAQRLCRSLATRLKRPWHQYR